jgi:hypothetical protein
MRLLSSDVASPPRNSLESHRTERESGHAVRETVRTPLLQHPTWRRRGTSPLRKNETAPCRTPHHDRSRNYLWIDGRPLPGCGAGPSSETICAPSGGSAKFLGPISVRPGARPFTFTSTTCNPWPLKEWARETPSALGEESGREMTVVNEVADDPQIPHGVAGRRHLGCACRARMRAVLCTQKLQLHYRTLSNTGIRSIGAADSTVWPPSRSEPS